jgi:glycopeptide antibiotics resistance protein
VSYYFGTEYNAYTNMVAKLSLFALLGILGFGWQNSLRTDEWRFFGRTLLIVVVAVSCAIELGQAFLPPLVPDFSDVIIYVVGYGAGYWITKLLWEGAEHPTATSELVTPNTLDG